MNKAAFYASLRKRNSGVFGASLSQGQVEGCEAILAAGQGMPVEHLAYCFATAYHEVGGTMQPVRETFAKTDGQAIARLEGAWKRGKLPWVKSPYWRKDAEGKSWLGRGLVQLTHRTNYVKAGALVNADLVGNPNLAMRADIAAKVLCEGSRVGMFTGKSLRDYGGASYDYFNARSIINGDKHKRVRGVKMGEVIARYARAFEAALRAADYEPTKRPKAPQSAPIAQTDKPTLAGALLRLLRAIFGRSK